MVAFFPQTLRQVGPQKNNYLYKVYMVSYCDEKVDSHREALFTLSEFGNVWGMKGQRIYRKRGTLTSTDGLRFWIEKPTYTLLPITTKLLYQDQDLRKIIGT